MSFLVSLANRNRSLALHDVSQLAQAKSSHLCLPSSSSTAINAWDREYYYSRSAQLSSHPTYSFSALSPYFSVGTCISGLSSLFKAIYGIHFEMENISYGEVWLHDEVKKLAVVDEMEGKIGEIYCDLFAREGKPTGAAHFTVRCSRRIDGDEPEKDFAYLHPDEAREVDFPLKTEGKKLPGREGQHQLPVVVLTCDFDRGSASIPGLLTWQEVETLFHEMGHAMHCKIFSHFLPLLLHFIIQQSV